MIGLGFLAVGLVWLAFSVYVATRLPKWLGIAKPIWRWVIGAVVLLLLLVGPFVDHVVGMRQFESLCAEETGLQISPNAANTVRALQPPSETESLEGFAIPIARQIRRVFDLDTGEQIAQYKYFSTPGGRIGGLVMLGGRYTCAASQLRHFDEKKFTDFAKRVNLTYGKNK